MKTMKLKPDQQATAIALLRELPLFSGVPADLIQSLVQFLEANDLAKGKVVIMEQEISRALYLLIKGSVGIWKRVDNQKKCVATLKAPNFFGERSMLKELPATALVKTEEESQLFILSRDSFELVAGKNPELQKKVLANLEVIETTRPSITKSPEAQEG